MKNIRSYVVCRMAGIVCMLALFSCVIGTKVHAVEDEGAVSQPAVVSSRTTDDGIYVYIKGVEEITSGTTVQIGNTLCEDIQVASVVSAGIPIKTTILLDNSISLSSKWGTQAKSLIETVIDNHAKDEEFRIITFADGSNVVADFSTDYEALKTTVGEIEFLDQNSYLTDILYDLLKQEEGSKEANFTRFIIITDGADDNEIKYTQVELLELMKNSGVVIHAAGVKASNNAGLLETLFSYTRQTGGVCLRVENDADVDSIKGMMEEDYRILCLKLVPKADIMDGGKKEAKFELNTSNGSLTLTASLQMPFADVSSMPAESTEPSAPAAAPAPSTEKAELPSIVVEPQAKEEASETEKSNMVPVIAGAVVLIVIVILAVVLICLKGKKKKQVDVVIAGNGQAENQAQNNAAAQASAGQPVQAKPEGGTTARLGAQQAAGTEGKTLRLQGSAQPMAKQTFIILTDISNPQRSFRAVIDTRIVIGRESGDILLGHDAAVSHVHCEIIKKGNVFYVNDLKSSNGTFYENMRVYSETPVMNGGVLEIGSGKYKITIED